MTKIQIPEDLIKKILEIAYLTVFSGLLIYSFLNTTMFQIQWSENFLPYMRILLITCIFLRMCYSERYSTWEMIICAGIFVVFAVVFRRNGFDEVLNTALLIIGARGISFKKLVKIYFAISLILLLITIAAALTGHIENLVYMQEGRNIRIAFGCNYPTDFSAHILYLVLAYAYLRKEKISYFELLLIGGLGVFVYIFCQARLNSICLGIIMFVFGGYKIWCKKCTKKKCIPFGWKISTVLSAVPVLCVGGMIICSMFFSSNNKFLVLLDRVLNYRLRLGKKGIDLYGLSYLGQWIPMQGNGGTVKEQVNYFFLDSSYLYVLLQYGIIVLMIILGAMLIINYRAYLNQDFVLILALCIVAIQCMVEHHLMDMAYNPFLWAVLADMTVRKVQGKSSI